MHTFVPAVVVFAALMWPAAAQAQSLGEVAQREAARRQAEANAPKTPAPAAKPSSSPLQGQTATGLEDSSAGTVSLAEVARREAARRKALAAAGERGKVLTNSDVKKWVPPAESETADAAPTDSQKPDEAPAADTSKAGEAKPKAGADEDKGEAYWRGRMIAAREDLRRNEAFAEALQSRINALSAEFSAKDDPYQRAQVADDRQKAIAELDRLTADIDKNKKAIADVEDDARRAGVPAGWIR
jgi:hypothetical protein